MDRRALLALIPAALAAHRPLRAEPASVELNEASRAELESLPGIGPELAARLLAARAQARFADWAELRRRVKGLGESGARRLSAHGLRINGLPFTEPAAAASAPAAAH